MGNCFSGKTEEGIRLVWMQYDKEQRLRGVELLREATEEGDVDAPCFLARCYMGDCYVWKYLGLPEDDRKAGGLLHESIRRGSGSGVLCAMRCGEMDERAKREMPFESLKQAYEDVLEKARAGQPFCQYVIGNVFYWGDVFEIENLDINDCLSTPEKKKEMIGRCIPWFERSIQNGCLMAGRNLRNLYNGEYGGLFKDAAKAEEVVRRCAAAGCPEWLRELGELYYNRKEYERSMENFKAAADKGQLDAWYDIGYQYEFGQGVKEDAAYALSCYENAIPSGHLYAAFRAGRILYFGGWEGEVPQDLPRAVKLLKKAAHNGVKAAFGVLGDAYLEGKGVEQDYRKALAYLQRAPESNLTNNDIGEIYADGLGVPEDLPKAVSYFQKCGSYGPAQQNLKRFKKTLFGGRWVRRK